MATIVTRSGKGSPLTNNEVDANFTNLNTELGTKANTSSLATVATTGAYADLTGKPTLVDASNVAITGGSITGTTIDSITNHVGADHIHYKIKATQILAKGDVVKVVGFNAGENAFEVAKVSASTDIAVGVVYSALSSGALGSIINTGLLEGIDTSAFAIGTTLYPNTSGGFTSTKPTSGRYQALAFVVRSNANNGTILIEASEPQATSLSQFTNDSGYITGITSGNVTTALGYTPANRAGDTFTGPITVNSGANQAILGSDGAIELTRGAGGAYIDFKDSTAEDFDVRLQASGSQLNISAAGGLTLNGAGVLTGITSGQVTTALGYTPYNATNPAGYITSAGSISGNAATATNISNTGTVTLASATESNSIYATAPSYTADQPTKLLNFDWYGNVFSLGNIRSGSTPSSGFGVYYTPSGGSRAEFMRIDTSGSVLINRTSASGIGKLNVEGGVDVTSGNVTVQAGYGIAWRGDQSRIMTPDDNSYGALIRWGATGGCRLFESTTERLRIDGTGSVTAFVDVRAPIFYDSNNTNRYLDPSSTSVLTTVEAYGSGFRSLVNGSASISSQLYFANAANTRAWNWQLDENDAAALWSYGGSSWGKRLGLTHNSELFLRNSSGSDVSLAYPSTFGYSSSYKTMVLGNQSLTTVCIGVSPASNPSGSFNGGGLGLEVMFRNGVNFITPNSANNGYHFPLSLADGYTASSGSFRAPIFYDSNDTGYYIDPNTSGTSAVFAGDIHINDTTWGADKALRFREGASDTYGGFIKYTAGDSLELGTRNNSTTDTRAIYISRGANWAGSDGSFRAPIFYDSENTAYYVDPNGGSRTGGITADSLQSLGNLTVNSGLVYRSDWTTRFQSGSDFTSGTLVTTDIPATGFAGESFVIEITGKSYSATNLPFKVVAQGYLYNDTIINYTGISYGGDFATYIKVFEEGGVLKFWWPRISYWNSFNVNVMAMDGPTNNTITRNRVTAIGNSTEPTGTKKQQINLIKTLKTGDAAGSISGFNNPTTAPTANTIVYRDGLGDISAREIVLSSGLSAQTPTVLVSMYPSTNQLVRTTPAAVAAAIQGAASGAWGINVTGKANDLNQARYVNTDFNTLGTSPQVFRAYTNYIPSGGSYNQPPNGSGDYKVIQWGDVEGGTSGNWGGQIVQNFYDDRMWFRRSYATTWQAWREFIHDGNYTNYAMPSGASATNSVDVRAPIFYDSNNTSYYLNPAEISVMWRMGANYFQSNNDVSVDTPFGIYFSSNLNADYAIYRESGAWSHPYPDLRIAFHTGIKIGAAAGYNGVRFYDNSDMLTQVMSVNNGSDALGTGNVYVNNSLQAGSSLRAPIFYDSDNTAYYVKPTGATSLRTVGDWRADSSAWTGEFNGKIQYHANNWYFQGANTWEFRRSDSANAFSVNQAGLAEARQDFRAPVFYDSNNTGYYIDPHATSNLNVLNIIGGNVVKGDSEQGRSTSSGNMNSLSDPSGFFFGVGPTGAPNAEWYNWINCIGNSWGGTDRYGFQIAHQFWNEDQLYVRRVQSGGWNTWRRIFTEGSVDVRAPIFYDRDNTAYYLDASSTGTSLNVAGSIVAAGNVTAYSDIRIKANVETIPSALDKLDLIRGVTYTRTDLDDKEQRYAGVIAQEIEAVLPEAVRDLGNIKAVDYNATIALLIQAVKELRDEVEMLKK